MRARWLCTQLQEIAAHYRQFAIELQTASTDLSGVNTNSKTCPNNGLRHAATIE
jgi:hypothetical protein